MFIELLWIDAKVRHWLTVAKDKPATPDVSRSAVRAALLILHQHAPSSIGRYRQEFPNFEELYHIAGLEPPAVGQEPRKMLLDPKKQR
jgi:hypothetical protein